MADRKNSGRVPQLSITHASPPAAGPAVEPRCVVTTTPRPIRIIRDLLSREGKDTTSARYRLSKTR